MTRPRVSSQRLLDFRSGGWVILLAVLLSCAAVGWRILAMSKSRGERAVGDGRNVATYGFDLTNCAVPRETLVAAGIPKDGLHALDLPALLRPAQVDSIARRTHRKVLVPEDRVIGVVVGGRARAYPIRFMNWHEVVNDTLGGRPILVTYSPLCDGVAVFDREIAGEILRFGVSGLLSNSNLLMYDERPSNREESLWSQLRACAIAGPRAAWSGGQTRSGEAPAAGRREVPDGSRLKVLPAALIGWAEWKELHPGTTVLAPVPRMAEEYRRDPYASYFASERLRFPVAPLPPVGELDLRTRMIAVRGGVGFRVFSIAEVSSHAGPDGTWRCDLDGTPVLLRFRSAPPSVTAEAADSGSPLPVIYAFWFAWYAARRYDLPD